MTITAQAGLREPIVAGVVTALVGFTSSFAVVIAGLRAVGATAEQAASGLFALTVVFGLGIIVLSIRSRAPVTLAWSTPGAALLVSMGAGYDAGWAAAVGAFLVVGGLILLVGLIPVLGGVLLSLCLAPMESLAAEPLLTLPVLIVWLVATRWLARWALPLTLLTALAVIAVYVWVHGNEQHLEATWLPTLSWTTPHLDVAAIVGIAIPLFVVTMASQNIPGVAVLSSFGYTTPWRAAMTVTGVGTAVVAPFGGHAINLAALSAALAAGDEAGPDRSRRWIAGVSAGVSYLVLAALSGALVTIAAIAPGGLVEAVAGLALLGTFAAAVVGAFTAVETRVPAALTFVAAASGLTFFGVGGAFWGLVIGLVAHTVLRPRTAAPR
jgi:benzoate membrane transport protein